MGSCPLLLRFGAGGFWVRILSLWCVEGKRNSHLAEESPRAAPASRAVAPGRRSGGRGRTAALAVGFFGSFSLGIGGEFPRLLTPLAALCVYCFAKSLNNLIAAVALIFKCSKGIKVFDRWRGKPAPLGSLPRLGLLLLLLLCLWK